MRSGSGSAPDLVLGSWVVGELDPRSGQVAPLGQQFVFRPPRHEHTEDLAVKHARKVFGSRHGHEWTKEGPDIVPLQEGEVVQMSSAMDKIRVCAKGGAVQWEVSGRVVMAEHADADRTPVEVEEDTMRTTKMVPMRLMLAWAAFMTGGWFSYFYSSQQDDVGGLPYARLSFALACAPGFSCCLPRCFGLAVNGSYEKDTKMTLFYVTLSVMLTCSLTLVPLDLGWGVRHLTLFWIGGGFCMCYMMIGMPIHWYRHGFPVYWKWFLVVLMSTLGSWISFYLIALLYIYIWYKRYVSTGTRPELGQ